MMKLFILLFCAVLTSHADYISPHIQPVRKTVVFPFMAESGLIGPADQAWWRIREILTEKKRLLVASKQFLLQKDVFQPRGELKVEDVTLLSGLLGADALITGHNVSRSFTLRVYEGKTGRLLFSKRLDFHPTLRASEQIFVVSERLVKDFISAIPYHGFVITDPIIGKTVFDKAGEPHVIADVGKTEGLTKDSEIQLVRMTEIQPLQPLLQGGATLDVIAEGKISEVRKTAIEIKLSRGKFDQISNLTMVKLSRDEPLTKNPYSGAEEAVVSGPAPTPPPSEQEEKKSQKNTGLVLGSILSILILLLVL